MKSTCILLLALLTAGGLSATQKPADSSVPIPTSHEIRLLEGWTVRVDERLLVGAGATVGERAIKLLDARLMEIALVLSEEPLARLREIPIQIDLTHGGLRQAQYHPSAGWLKANGYPETLAKCVHVPDAAHFLSRFENHRMPFVMLHELAHGYHDCVLGFGEARIAAAWAKWRQNDRYKRVLMDMGDRREHYGRTNDKEFFAEMTEAYLGQNDFFPFNAGELQETEPEIYRLMEEIWGPLPQQEKAKAVSE